MEHILKAISDVEKEISVTISATEVAERFSEVYRQIARAANLKGFRPGKAPLSVLKQFYGKAAAEEVEAHFIETGIREVVAKENLRLIERPVVTQRSPIFEHAEFTFSFKVETFPSIEASEREYRISYTPVSFREEMLEDELMAFRRRYTTFSKVDRPARDGDRVTVTFTGTLEGKEVPGVKGESVPVTLGERHFIEGFEAMLRDRRAGDTFTEPVLFPETYHAKDVAGKSVDFAVEVLAVEEASTPELTDEFVAAHHEKAKTVAELRDLVRADIQRSIDDINRETERHILVERYVREHDFPIPQTFLEAEIASRRESYRRRHHVEEVLPAEEARIREEATFAAKRFFLLNHFAQMLGIEASDEDLDRELAAEAARYGIPLEHFKRYIGEQALMERRFALREKRVVDRLMEKAVFERTPLPEEEKNDKR